MVISVNFNKLGKNGVGIMSRLFVLGLVFSIFLGCAHARYKSIKYDSSCVKQYDSRLKRDVYTQVDQLPEFPGGLKALVDFTVKRGRVHQEEPTQGTFRFELVIDDHGTVIDQKIIGKEPEAYNKNDIELIKGFKKMPKWIPAKCKNRNVLFRYPIIIYSNPGD